MTWNGAGKIVAAQSVAIAMPRRSAVSEDQKSKGRRISRPLVGSFEENILNNRIEPIRTVDGYTAEVRASCNQFHPSPLKADARVSFFSAGDCFPYLGQVSIGRHGYRVPKKGTLQVALFNPNGTVVKLFVLLYDLTDMPPNSQTFLRQRTMFLQSEAQENSQAVQTDQQVSRDILREQQNKEWHRVRYLIQLK